MTTKRFTISGLHCITCSLAIEETLADFGVAAHVHYANQYVDCSYDETKISTLKIKKAIESLGYTVTG